MYGGLSSLGVKSKSTNVPIEDSIVKARNLNKRKRENRKARVAELRSRELKDMEAMADAAIINSGCRIRHVDNGNLNVEIKPSPVVCVREADSRGGGCTGFERQRHPTS